MHLGGDHGNWCCGQHRDSEAPPRWREIFLETGFNYHENLVRQIESHTQYFPTNEVMIPYGVHIAAMLTSPRV